MADLVAVAGTVVLFALLVGVTSLLSRLSHGERSTGETTHRDDAREADLGGEVPS